jgi:ribose 5-phosphate isomerase
MERLIYGIQMDNRKDDAVRVQKILTDYGCIIKTRIGLHQQNENDCCSKNGLVILELTDNCSPQCQELEKKLNNIDGVNIQKMSFEYNS